MYLLPGSVNAASSSGQLEALGGLKLFPELTPPVEAVLFVDFAPPPPDALSSPWSPADVATIAQQRLAALALRLIAEHRNRVQAESVAYLRAASFEGASRTLQVVGASADALAGLREHQIPFTITKGPGIALEAHNPAERPFVDLDILVAPADFKSAAECPDLRRVRRGRELPATVAVVQPVVPGGRQPAQPARGQRGPSSSPAAVAMDPPRRRPYRHRCLCPPAFLRRRAPGARRSSESACRGPPRGERPRKARSNLDGLEGFS